jgi:hypothetical protein
VVQQRLRPRRARRRPRANRRSVRGALRDAGLIGARLFPVRGLPVVPCRFGRVLHCLQATHRRHDRHAELAVGVGHDPAPARRDDLHRTPGHTHVDVALVAPHRHDRPRRRREPCLPSEDRHRPARAAGIERRHAAHQPQAHAAVTVLRDLDQGLGLEQHTRATRQHEGAPLGPGSEHVDRGRLGE